MTSVDDEELARFGWDEWFRARLGGAVGEVARVAVDDGVAYVVWSARGAREARLAGKMLRAVRTRQAPRPVVGDWLLMSPEGSRRSAPPPPDEARAQSGRHARRRTGHGCERRRSARSCRGRERCERAQARALPGRGPRRAGRSRSCS